MVINENITDKCAQMYQDDYPHLWDSFKLEVGMFYFYVTLLGLLILCSLIGCCFLCCKPDAPSKKLNELNTHLNNIEARHTIRQAVLVNDNNV